MKVRVCFTTSKLFLDSVGCVSYILFAWSDRISVTKDSCYECEFLTIILARNKASLTMRWSVDTDSFVVLHAKL